MNFPSPYDPKKVLVKLMKYCAYQDRCISEVTQKMKQLNVPYEERDGFVDRLIDEKFLDEDRFLQSYVKGKFKGNKWGKTKIRYLLKQKGISDQLITQKIEEFIKEEDYYSTLTSLLTQKYNTLKEDLHPSEKKQKLIAFAYSRGFEVSYSHQIAEQLIKSPTS